MKENAKDITIIAKKCLQTDMANKCDWYLVPFQQHNK